MGLLLETRRKLSPLSTTAKNWVEGSSVRGQCVQWNGAGVTYPGHPQPEKHTRRECNLRTWDKLCSIKNTQLKGLTKWCHLMVYSQCCPEPELLQLQLEGGQGCYSAEGQRHWRTACCQGTSLVLWWDCEVWSPDISATRMWRRKCCSFRAVGHSGHVLQ
jgi:hypothetical protein